MADRRQTEEGATAAGAPVEQREPAVGDRSESAGRSGQTQDPQQQAEIEKLKQRDREVRTHEMAHVAAGGQYVTRGASFTYKKGPDGQLYAVGGEVGIDTSAVPGDPQATLQKALAVQRAALAPADPSAQDRGIAARAARMAARARTELATSRTGQPAGVGLGGYRPAVEPGLRFSAVA